jgi:hypothetical protein
LRLITSVQPQRTTPVYIDSSTHVPQHWYYPNNDSSHIPDKAPLSRTEEVSSKARNLPLSVVHFRLPHGSTQTLTSNRVTTTPKGRNVRVKYRYPSFKNYPFVSHFELRLLAITVTYIQPTYPLPTTPPHDNQPCQYQQSLIRPLLPSNPSTSGNPTPPAVSSANGTPRPSRSTAKPTPPPKCG